MGHPRPGLCSDNSAQVGSQTGEAMFFYFTGDSILSYLHPIDTLERFQISESFNIFS